MILIRKRRIKVILNLVANYLAAIGWRYCGGPRNAGLPRRRSLLLRAEPSDRLDGQAVETAAVQPTCGLECAAGRRDCLAKLKALLPCLTARRPRRAAFGVVWYLVEWGERLDCHIFVVCNWLYSLYRILADCQELF